MADFLNNVKTSLGFSAEDTTGDVALESTIIDPITGVETSPPS